jgi:hypothetical protein
MFPNPFEVHEWGARGENPADPATVEYLAFRPDIVGGKLPPAVLDAIAKRQFRKINEDRDLVIYERVEP